MIPIAGDEDSSSKGWAKIYKLLISPFSNTFKNFIQVQLREKLLQESEKATIEEQQLGHLDKSNSSMSLYFTELPPP